MPNVVISKNLPVKGDFAAGSNFVVLNLASNRVLWSPTQLNTSPVPPSHTLSLYTVLYIDFRCGVGCGGGEP